MNDTKTGQLNTASLQAQAYQSQTTGYAKLAEQYYDPRDSRTLVWKEPMKPEYAEGDITSAAKGSTARANGGKAKWDYLPLHLLEGVVRVLEKGAVKYAKWNWTKGSVWSTPFNSALRHLWRFYWFQEDIDPETGEHHIDHAITNLIFLKHYINNYKEGDDRPDAWKS